MTATPDAFSMADLQAMLENAPQDITDVPASDASEDDNSRMTRLCDIAEKVLNSVPDELSGGDTAQVHKAMLHMLVSHMCEWHTRVAHMNIEDGEDKSAVGWARDAGKFQAIANILSTIEVGDDDFTCTVK